MSREIKFMAWCEAIEEMRPVQNLDVINKVLSCCETDYFLRYENIEGNSFEAVLLQSIGRKDDHGEDIYEDYAFHVTDDDGLVVRTHIAKMDAETLSIDERLIGSIVGNIHQNKDLLKCAKT